MSRPTDFWSGAGRTAIRGGQDRREPTLTTNISSPARKPKLLGLFLHVLVVELGAVFGAPDAGAHLDGDPLQVRTLDR